MAKTQIADIIVPEVFNPYVVEKTKEISRLYQSGIVSNDPALDALASSGGTIINLPFFNDLTGDSEVLSDTTPLTPGKITAAQDAAVLHTRGKAWSVNDLAKALSGADPMGAIGDLVAAYWARQHEKILLSSLKGVFAASSMSGKVLDDSTNPVSAGGFLDACQLMGDAKDDLTAVAMHSATETELRKADLLKDTVLERDVKPVTQFMGLTVIVDDSVPVGTIYIFGSGAFGWGNGSAPVPTETDRDSLAGDDILINRAHFIMHPRGVRWIGTAAGTSPTNAELETAANWNRVYEPKNVRLVEYLFKA